MSSSSNQRLFASIDGRVSPLANQEVVFYDPARDQTHVMTMQVLQALDLCRPFRSLEQHVAALGSALEGLRGQEDAIRRVLESLVARGLLISDETWLDQLGRSQQHPPAEFAGIFIRAGGDPSLLQGLLDSLLAYEQAFAPGHRYVLLDDGRDAAGAGRRRQLLRDFAAAAEAPASYIGGDAWKSLVSTLEGLAPGVPAALLTPPDGGDGGGAARNLASLLSAGRRYLMLDEGMRFPLHRHGASLPGLDVAATADMPQLQASLDEAVAAGDPLQDDPLQLHLRVCGAALGDLVNRVPGFELGREQLAGLAPSRLSHLGAGGRVMATAVGVRGAAVPGPWLFQLDAADRTAFAGDRDRYLRHLEAPAACSVSARVQLRSAGALQPLMLDNAEPAPCVPGGGEDADALFSSLWRAMAPGRVSVHFPATLATVVARRDGSWLKQPLTRSSNAYLADLTARVDLDVRARDPWARLRSVSGRLADLAASSDSSLRIELREYHAFARSSLIQSLQHIYEQAAPTAPLHWQADLRQVIEANGRALIDGGEPRLSDCGGPERAEHALRTVLQRQCAALDAWPTLWEAARDRAEQLWKRL
jgi:hypothetical protein